MKILGAPGIQGFRLPLHVALTISPMILFFDMSIQKVQQGRPALLQVRSQCYYLKDILQNAMQIWQGMGGNRPTSAQQIEHALWSALFDIATQDLDATRRMKKAFEDMGEVLQGEFEQKEVKWFASSAVVEPSTAQIVEEPMDTRHPALPGNIEMQSGGQHLVAAHLTGGNRSMFAGNTDGIDERRMGAPGERDSDMSGLKDKDAARNDDIEGALNDTHLTESVDVEMGNSPGVQSLPTTSEDVEMKDGTVEDSVGVDEMELSELSSDEDTEPLQRARPNTRARKKGTDTSGANVIKSDRRIKKQLPQSQEPPHSNRKALTQDRSGGPSRTRAGRGDRADNPIVLDLLPVSSRCLRGRLIEVIDLTRDMVRAFVLKLPTTHHGI
jgi:hypothetical protein